MKNSVCILAIIFMLSLFIAPASALTYKQWQGVTGLGAIGGALAGIMIYREMSKEKRTKKHPNEALIIGHHKPKKEKNRGSIFASFCSGIVGATAGGLTLGWWFWSNTPQSRQQQAQELVHLAQMNRFIAQNFDINNQIAVQNTVREIYAQNGQEFNRALWEMTTFQTNLERAQNLCAQAYADAQDNALLQGAIGQTHGAVNNLRDRVAALAQAIRNNPAYQVELAAAAQRRQNQEEIWRQEFQRQQFQHGWRWHFTWNRPAPYLVQPQPIFVPQPIVIAPPAVHYPVMDPRPHHFQIHIPPAHIPAPRPPIAHAHAAPAVPYGNPVPAPLGRLIMQANARQQGQQAPFHAPAINIVPMHPAQLGRGHRPF